jgi:2-polyprenyl-6-methoxyphenol hydroxylase-like FAD-dependent oxidoreductase
MLAYLLARAGVGVTVLEKHADFLRDFRGDTVHPSTLDIMFELGLLDEFLERPHQEVRELSGEIGRARVRIADFTRVPTHCKFVALMPQWEFLNFLAEKAAAFPSFSLLRRAEVTGIKWAGGAARIVGLKAKTPDGEIDVDADLVVGADGRSSVVRQLAGLTVDDVGAPIDVLWMRMSRLPSDSGQTFGHVEAGAILVMLDRGDYWQCAYVIPKGGFDAIRTSDIEAFRARLAAMEPFLADRVGELKDWDDVKLLTVKIDRLRDWCLPGLLCIGDAAHAMSPIGGVGINLAIQDAVAAANAIAAPLANGRCTVDDLRKVQRRREWPTRVIQRVQVLVQERIIFPTLGRTTALDVPWPLRLIDRSGWLRGFPARLVGVGVRPEHVRTPRA